MRGPRAILICVLALGLYALVAYSAARNSSVTFDETLHVASAYMVRHHGDFRLNPEDPPLFQRLAATALPAGSLTPDLEPKSLTALEANPFVHWPMANTALFGARAGEAHDLTMAARARMLVPAVLLGAMTILLAALLAARAPALAALIAAGLFCLDPTLLGHGPLVKNDVTLALAFAACAAGTVLAGQKLTPARVGLIALGAAIGVTSKFSGLLLGPAVAIALACRALSATPWPVAGRELRSRAARLAAVAGVCVVCSLACWGAVWAAYGFRHGMAPGLDRTVDLATEKTIAKTNLAYLRHWGATTPEDIAAAPVPMPILAAEWSAQHRLIPESFAKGFAFTYATTLLRNGYLLGEVSTTGWWYYFPLVAVFKLPLGTLALLAIAAATAIAAVRAGGRSTVTWPVLAVGVIAGFYLATAVSGSFNLGIRHLIPALPLVYALAAAGLATRLAGANLAARLPVVVVVAFAGLALETASRFPHYIAFFNAPSRAYGPVRLLGDSNLDWGQDLPLLADWQRRNPNVPLSLAYFGTATPEAYGLRITPLPGTSYATVPPVASPGPGVVAITASHLQELTLTPAEMGRYDLFRRLRPREVLGDTIFLFDWPAAPGQASERPIPLSLRRGADLRVITSPTPSQR